MTPEPEDRRQNEWTTITKGDPDAGFGEFLSKYPDMFAGDRPVAPTAAMGEGIPQPDETPAEDTDTSIWRRAVEGVFGTVGAIIPDPIKGIFEEYGEYTQAQAGLFGADLKAQQELGMVPIPVFGQYRKGVREKREEILGAEAPSMWQPLPTLFDRDKNSDFMAAATKYHEERESLVWGEKLVTELLNPAELPLWLFPATAMAKAGRIAGLGVRVGKHGVKRTSGEEGVLADEIIRHSDVISPEHGAAAEGAMPLNDLAWYKNQVVTTDDPIIKTLVGKWINPSLAGNSDQEKLIAAYARKLVDTHDLQKLYLAAHLDIFASRGWRKVLGWQGDYLPVQKDGFVKGTKYRWEDVFSKPDDPRWAHVSGPGTNFRQYIDAYHQVLDTADGWRNAGGVPILKKITGEEGWFYVPRQVKGLHGLEMQKPSDPRAQRLWQDATDGAIDGIDYSNNPRYNLEVNMRQSVNEIINKELENSMLEMLPNITSRQLVPKDILARVDASQKALDAATREAKRHRNIFQAATAKGPKAARAAERVTARAEEAVPTAAPAERVASSWQLRDSQYSRNDYLENIRANRAADDRDPEEALQASEEVGKFLDGGPEKAKTGLAETLMLKYRDVGNPEMPPRPGQQAGTVTRMVATEDLQNLRGAAREDISIQTGAKKVPEELVSSMREKGYVGDDYIQVALRHNGEPVIYEGNRRAAAAARAGLEEVPVKIYYTSGSSYLPDLGVWAPSYKRPTATTPPTAAPVARVTAESVKAIQGAKTGAPFSGVFFRGTGRATVEEAYAPQGIQQAVFGDAVYTTPNRAFAEFFGPQVDEIPINLKNPLVIETDAQWLGLTREAGWFSREPTTPTDIASMRKLIEQKQFDGVIVRVPESELVGKSLQSLFESDTVVRFAKVVDEPVISAAARVAEDIGPRLPQKLRDTRVTYGAPKFGKKRISVLFARDIDKALFIIGKRVARPHPAYDDFLSFVTKETGMREEAAQAIGRELQGVVDQLAADLPSDAIRIRVPAGSGEIIGAAPKVGGVPRVITPVEQRFIAAVKYDPIAARRAEELLESARREVTLANRQLKTAQERANTASVGPGHLFGYAEKNIKIKKWVGRGPGAGRFFPLEIVEDLEKGIQKIFEPVTGIYKIPETAGQAARFLSAGLDWAMPLTHGLLILGRRPDQWAQIVWHHFRTFFTPGAQAKDLRDHFEVYKEMVRNGISIGDPELYRAIEEGGILRPGAVLEFLLPEGVGHSVRDFARAGGRQTFGRFQAQYSMGLRTMRRLMWQSHKAGWKGQEQQLAQYIRNMTGGLDSRALGVGPKQSAVESTWMAFSPRLLRSTVSLFYMAVKPWTREGREALRSLTQLGAGAMAMYYVVGLALGKSHEEIKEGYDPTKGKQFLSYNINGDWIGVGGQVRALSQALIAITSAAGGGENARKLLELNAYENPIIKLWFSRGAPFLRMTQGGIEYATGGEVNAAPYDSINTAPDLLKHLGTSFVPFSVQGKMEGEQAVTTAFAFQGFRTSPATAAEARNEARGVVMMRLGYSGKFSDLPQDLQSHVNAQQEVRDAQELVNERSRQRGSGYQVYREKKEKLDRNFRNMVVRLSQSEKLSDFRARYGVLQNERAIAKANIRAIHAEDLEWIDEQEPSSHPFDVAFDDYMAKIGDPALEDPLTGDYDFDERMRRERAFQATYGDAMLRRVREYMYRNQTPIEEELRTVRNYLRPYWQIKSRFLQGNPGVSRLLDQIEQNQKPGGNLATALRLAKHPLVKRYRSYVRTQRADLRMRSPRTGMYLVAWYDRKPSNSREMTMARSYLSNIRQVVDSVEVKEAIPI